MISIKSIIRDTLTICTALVAVSGIALSCIFGIKYINEKGKNSNLHSEINELEQELNNIKGTSSEYFVPGAFNYLAIGNSITNHGECDYWWNQCGMAASTPDKDYVHRVVSYLSDTYENVRYCTCGLYNWEVQATDRAEVLTLLDKYLYPKLNLITVQLSENVIDTTTFEADFNELINYIATKSTEAQIIIVDDFWDGEIKSPAKKRVAESKGLGFADLSGARGVGQYYCGMGTTVYDKNNSPHKVNHEGVAAHPGDKGMEYIANKIINLIE